MIKSQRIGDKISLIVPNLAGGGAERVMVILANEFSRKGISTDLVIVNNDSMHYAKEVSSEVNLVNLNRKRVQFAIPALRRYLISTKPNAVVSTITHMSAAVSISLAFSHLKNTKFFPREDRAPKHISIRTPYLYFLGILTGMTYKAADGVISLSEDMALELKSYYSLKTPIHTIYNPIDVESVLANAQLPPSPALPWPDEAITVLGVGRLTPQKDFPTLIKSVAKLRKNCDIKLVILGEGPERNALESLSMELGMSDSIYMPGFVDNPFAFMKASRFFVLSSITEGLPNSLIQALICGTTCISTNCPTGPREVLQNGKLGALVEIGDHNAIASAINDGLTKTSHPPPPSKTMFKQLYDASHIADEYLRVISSHL